jgi:hypothetical protein
MQSDLRDQILSLSATERQRFTLSLWLNLTIAVRSIWSNDRFGDSEKLAGLKWLNEIQHRAYGVHVDQTFELSTFLDLVNEHVRQAEHIRGDVGRCLTSALKDAIESDTA